MLFRKKKKKRTTTTDTIAREESVVTGKNGNSTVVRSCSAIYQRVIIRTRFPEPANEGVSRCSRADRERASLTPIFIPLLPFVPRRGGANSLARELGPLLRSIPGSFTSTVIRIDSSPSTKVDTQVAETRIPAPKVTEGRGDGGGETRREVNRASDRE